MGPQLGPGGDAAIGPVGQAQGVGLPAGTSADEVENRVLDRVEAWLAVELDDRVMRIVEEKLREETERRAWRRGLGVY